MKKVLTLCICIQPLTWTRRSTNAFSDPTMEVMQFSPFRNVTTHHHPFVEMEMMASHPSCTCEKRHTSAWWGFSGRPPGHTNYGFIFKSFRKINSPDDPRAIPSWWYLPFHPVCLVWWASCLRRLTTTIANVAIAITKYCRTRIRFSLLVLGSVLLRKTLVIYASKTLFFFLF